MAQFVLTNPEIAIHGSRLTPDLGAVAVDASRELVVAPVFGSKSQRRHAGLRNPVFSVEGYHSDTYGAIAGGHLFESKLVTFVGHPAVPIVSPSWFGIAHQAEATVGGEVGTMFALTAAGEIDGELVAGVLTLHQQITAAGGAVVSGGIEVPGGLPSARHHAALGVHAYTSSGGTVLEFKIESAADSGFSAPTTRASGTIADTGGSYTTVAGPITDSWWRTELSMQQGDAADALASMGSVITGAV